MLNTLVLGQALIGTRVHGWGDARKAAPLETSTATGTPTAGNQTR